MIVLNEQNSQIGYVKNLGQVLFKDFLLPFELSAVLLFSAIIGAVVLVKHEVK